jgi:hypothetical protein
MTAPRAPRFRSRLAHRIHMRILPWLPQEIWDRFDRHLLRYASADDALGGNET